MKALLSLAALLLLCSCGTAPQVESFGGPAAYGSGPTSASDPRLRHPQFYMDDADSLPDWTHIAPQSNR